MKAPCNFGKYQPFESAMRQLNSDQRHPYLPSICDFSVSPGWQLRKQAAHFGSTNGFRKVTYVIYMLQTNFLIIGDSDLRDALEYIRQDEFFQVYRYFFF